MSQGGVRERGHDVAFLARIDLGDSDIVTMNFLHKFRLI